MFNYIKSFFPVKHIYILEQDSRIFWPVYKCKYCNKVLHLEAWQMNDLPNNMKYGCMR